MQARAFFAIAVIALFTFGSAVVAGEPPQYDLNIERQPLGRALQQFAKQSGVQIVFFSKATSGCEAVPLNGRYSAAAALSQLLGGCPLTFRELNATTIEVQAKPALNAEGVSSSEAVRFFGDAPIRIAQAGALAYTAQNEVAQEQKNAPARSTQPSASKEQGAQELIVTAERLGRSVMNTATSVVVLDAEALDQRAGLNGIQDLIASMPNVAATGRSSFAPSIRGVDGTGPAYGADAFFAGTRPRLNIQVDDRPASYNEVIFGDFGVWDVQQVEILRGPQSTLQGRNSVAGTVAIKTADPTYDTEIKVRAFAGNLETRQYSAALSAPLVDGQLAFRIAADHRTNQSFVPFTPFPGSSDPGKFEGNTYRAKLLIEPNAVEGLSALITLNHTDFEGTQSEAVREPFDQHLNRFDTTSAVFKPSSNSGIAVVRWDVNDAIDLQARVSYSDLDIKRKARPGGGNATINGHELVAEPSVGFQARDGRIKGLVGAYFFDASQDEAIDLFGGGTFKDSTRTNAVFGESTFGLSETFDLTLGARYEEERRRRNGSIFLFVIDLDEKYETFMPKLVLSWHPSKTLTLGALLARGYNGGGAGFTYNPPFAAYTFGPEYVWNYEAFARASLADGRIMVAGNLFYSDYQDMQLPYYLSSVSTVVRNAEKVVTHGAEATVTWLAQPGLRINAGVGVVRTDIESFPASGVEGNELQRAPHFSASLGMHYAHSTGLELSLDARHSGGYFSTVVNNPLGKVGAYWIANSQVAYTYNKAKIFAYARNLFDADDPLIINPGDAFGPTYAQIIPPRTYGLGVQMNF